MLQQKKKGIMISFHSIQSRNKNLNVSKSDIHRKIETFKTSLDDVCNGNIETINKSLFPELYFRGVKVFQALTVEERNLNGHWYR